MYLTNEQREIGKMNFLTALGGLRGDFLTKSLSAGSIGSHYFGYGKVDKPVRAGIIGTGDEGCQAMIAQSSPGYLEYVAYCDIRPTQIERGRRTFVKLYGPEQGGKVKFHDSFAAMLADKDIEAIVIATPLWTHAPLAIEALEKGKHVFCEKLMAYDVRGCKQMCRTATKAGKILAIGHQRHYSTLYDNALAVMKSGVLGDVRHIRALWHRNNTWPGLEAGLHDGWSRPIPDEDKKVDFAKYGYKSIEELIRWRLYNRTGGGLMAELGSHQLDACSLFLGKVHPQSVQGVGGKMFYTDDRECEDHVYCAYEMPGEVVLTYSSINTNALEGYGEIIMGVKGTLMVLNERDVMLFKEREPGEKKIPEETLIRLTTDRQIDDTESLALPPEAALAKVALEKATMFTPIGDNKPMINRGYHEELEAFAFAVRNPGAELRCPGTVALADAVMALSANLAMRGKKRIEFKDAWYNVDSDETPEG